MTNPELHDVLKHVGIKGMKWGVRRDRNRVGGADGKEESTKVKDNRSKLSKTLGSLSRERQWNKVLKNMHKLDTKEINKVAGRIKLENNLKSLSKSKVGSKKDRDDYIRREHMSDAELSRKVVRLRAKDGLRKAVKDASKEQRVFGENVVRIGGSIGVKFAVKKAMGQKLSLKDVFDVATDGPKKASKQAKTDLLKSVEDNPAQHDVLKRVLDKIDKPDK